jgi:hypothetical protein
MSSFTWLDYSEHERRKMLDVVDLFKERDTRDELGIGAVRDSFADQLFPGTSTIMTRARYFLIVPWTFQRLETRRVSSAQMPDRARRAETDLIEAIEQSDDKDRNIGKYAKTTLKRLPSSVYWQGLAVWGIRTFAGSQSQYYRSLDHHYSQVGRHSRRKEERDAEHDDLVVPNWHAGLIAPSEKFPEECSLRLTRAEAEYLSERICLSPRSAGSLLAELVARRQPWDQVAFAWEHPQFKSLPASLREKLLHAQNFSEVMHGASLLYNLILAEEAHWNDGLTDYRDRFAKWAKAIAVRSGALKEWNRERFWEIVRIGNPRIRGRSQDFINAWWTLALGTAPERLCASPNARRLITERERQLKKNLARINNPRAQELWNGESGSDPLEFRWQISQRILTDIFQGLERSHA